LGVHLPRRFRKKKKGRSGSSSYQEVIVGEPSEGITILVPQGSGRNQAESDEEGDQGEGSSIEAADNTDKTSRGQVDEGYDSELGHQLGGKLNEEAERNES
jgi:hypothetical protein